MRDHTGAGGGGDTEKSPEAKLEELYRLLGPYRKVILAFSGGVDSTFLLRVLKEDPDRQLLAVTALSSTYPQRQRQEARELAHSIGVAHLEIETDEIRLDGFRGNPPDRCYYCKRELFSRLEALRLERGYDIVMDGSNYDDTADYRPGMRACKELKVISPLQECGMTKADIRHLSRTLGLPTWDKPSFACLSSRFPYGTEITEGALRQIDRCEGFLAERIKGHVRVRYHGPVARIEVEPWAIPHVLALREEIIEFFTTQGFTYVTLDLEGYRTGSMNEVLLPGRERDGRL
jgi:uncharacterized protein